MACTLPPRDEPFRAPASRAMTRCECSGVSFEEAARSVSEGSVSLDEVSRRTGCGGNCTACIPDFKRYLAARGLR
jgi:bacterioferritin-associated ferredoxin